MKKKSFMCGGSITVEAAFVVPSCFLVLLSLSCLFQMIVSQNKIQMGMLQAAQTYSSQGKQLASLETWTKYGTVLRWKETESDAVCYTDYSIGIPFLGSGFCRLNRYQQMVVNDYSGVSMIPEDMEEGYVFIAENGHVYHLDRECPYLRIKIKSVTMEQTIDLRNQSGGKYYPCEGCCTMAVFQNTDVVYLTVYGNRYHRSKTCSQLKRTVRRVHCSEIGNLPLCSKCKRNQ